MSIKENDIQIKLESQRELWVSTVRSIADRLSSLVGPSASDVAWLSGMVGQLAIQSSDYSETRGRLIEKNSPTCE
jgi:hypothetical protein